MSSLGSRSRSSSRGNQRSPSPKRQPKINKLFVTNLDANVDTRKLEEQLKVMFSKFGEITSLVVKRSHNNEYCFAFVDYKEGDDATDAMKELNGVQVGCKDMKVELQDNSRRRKATSGGQCYKCGKPGHFARECRSDRPEERRGRSRSKERDRKKKKSHRHRSESSESAHAKKKDKKKHKSHKKHKKSKKKHYSSDSSDSD